MIISSVPHSNIRAPACIFCVHRIPGDFSKSWKHCGSEQQGARWPHVILFQVKCQVYIFSGLQNEKKKSCFLISISSCYCSLRYKVYAVDPFHNLLNIFSVSERKKKSYHSKRYNCFIRNNYFLEIPVEQLRHGWWLLQFFIFRCNWKPAVMANYILVQNNFLQITVNALL